MLKFKNQMFESSTKCDYSYYNMSPIKYNKHSSFSEMLTCKTFSLNGLLLFRLKVNE